MKERGAKNESICCVNTNIYCYIYTNNGTYFFFYTTKKLKAKIYNQ